MKKDILNSFLSAFLIYSLFFFISCASKQTVDEADAGDDVQEELVLDDAEDGDEFAALEDMEESASEDLEGEEEDLELAQVQNELQELEEQTEEAAEEAEQADEEIAEQLEEQQQVAAVSPQEEEEAPAQEEEREEALAELLETDQAPSAVEEPAEEYVDAEPMEESYSDEPETPRVVISSTPKVASDAFDKSGTWLNRFYFVRKGDTRESVAQLLYGSSEQAGALRQWNRGGWRPGKVVYYASPFNPKDATMRSFYEERQVSPESYQVRKGDWLSTVAEGAYGDIRSWKEVAVMNSLASPDAISTGQSLTMFPANLSDYSFQRIAQAQQEEQERARQEQLAQAEAEKAAQQAAAEQAAAQQQADETEMALAEAPAGNEAGIPPMVADTAQEQQRSAAPPPRPKRQKPRAGFNVAHFVQQNLFTLAIGGLIILLLLSLSIVNRRRRAIQEENDEFTPSRRAR